MSTKTKTTQAKATITQEKPAATPIRTRNPERYAAFVKAERYAVNARLEGYFKDFLKDGLSEEKHFLTEVFSWWESGFGDSGVKAYGEHEIPLFSAIQDRLNGMHLVPVDSQEMVREVEEFITAKLEAGWKVPKRHYGSWNKTDEQIKERLTGVVTRQVQFFAHRCKRTDLNFMVDLLEQWETLTDNDEFWQNTEHPLAAAAEIYLSAMKRREKEAAA